MIRAVFSYAHAQIKQPENQNCKNETIRAYLLKASINRAEIARIREKDKRNSKRYLSEQAHYEDGIIVLGAPNQYNPNLFPIGDGFGLFVFFDRYETAYFRNGVKRKPTSKPRGPRKKKKSI